MAELLTAGREALGAISEESSALMKQVETWREKKDKELGIRK